MNKKINKGMRLAWGSGIIFGSLAAGYQFGFIGPSKPMVSTRATESAPVATSTPYVTYSRIAPIDANPTSIAIQNIQLPDPTFDVRTLEDIITTNIDPAKSYLSEWDMITFQLLAPIKRDIELSAGRYGLDPVWLAQVGILESNYDPLSFNSASNDYGVYQIKMSSEKLAKQLASDRTSEYRFLAIDTSSNIFNPQTNALMAGLLMKYNSNRSGFTDTDRLYALYVRGEGAFDSNGRIVGDAVDIVRALNQRRVKLETIVPLFSIPPDQLSKLPQAEVSATLALYHSGATTQAIYGHVVESNLALLREDKSLGDAQSTLRYSTAVIAAGVLHAVYGQDMTAQLTELSGFADKIAGATTDADLVGRARGYQLRIAAVLEDRVMP